MVLKKMEGENLIEVRQTKRCQNAYFFFEVYNNGENPKKGEKNTQKKSQK